jgi:hypothetical protein
MNAVPISLAALVGAAGGGQPVRQSLGLADVALSGAVGHAAEFLDVGVDQRAGIMLVIAADWVPGDPVDR